MPPEHGPESFPEDVTATKPRRHRIVHSSRWWLAAAFAISVIVHILLGIGGQHLGLFGKVEKQVARKNDTIDLTIRPAGPIKPSASPDTGSRPTPGPRATPEPTRRIAVTKQPPVTTERPRPQEVTRPTPIRPATPTPATPPPSLVERPIPKRPTESSTSPILTERTPTTTAVTPRIAVRTPTTGGGLPDRLPEPLPPGEITGIPNTSELPRATRNPATVRIASAPRRSTESGGKPEGENRPREDNTPSPVPVGTGEATPAESSGAGNAAGPRSAATAAIGIDRGIPFGHKLGIYGGNPAGGGGAGRGAGGAASDASVSNEGGKFRVSFKRTASGESTGPAAKIAYVLDVSWSMNSGGKMRRAHDALNQALDELRPDDQFTIVTFANDARSTRMLPATRAGLSIGHANVSSAQPEPGGNTNLSAAIDLALGLPGITHVFILSDGEPTEGITDPAELLTFARKKNTRKARIITMALISSDDRKGFTLLKEIAEQHNGLFDFVDVR